MKRTNYLLFSIFISLIFLSSCKTSKMLSIDEATEMEEEKVLLLHTPTKVYNLRDFKFLEDKLIGQLKHKTKQKGYTIHVYTNLNYEFNDKYHSKNLELSISHIKKLTYSKAAPGKTALLGSSIFIAAIWIFMASINISG